MLLRELLHAGEEDLGGRLLRLGVASEFLLPLLGVRAAVLSLPLPLLSFLPFLSRPWLRARSRSRCSRLRASAAFFSFCACAFWRAAFSFAVSLPLRVSLSPSLPVRLDCFLSLGAAVGEEETKDAQDFLEKLRRASRDRVSQLEISDSRLSISNARESLSGTRRMVFSFAEACPSASFRCER